MTVVTEVRTSRTRMIVVGIVWPVVMMLVGLALILIALPQLPSPLAVHWGPGGAPDGFAGVLAPILTLGIPVLGYGVLAGLVIARSHPAGPGFAQRGLLSVGVFLGALLTVLIVGSTLLQRGLDDARDAQNVLPIMLVSLAVALLFGAVAWLLLPAVPDAQLHDQEGTAPVLALGSGVSAVWMRRAEPRIGYAIVLGVIVLIMTGGAVVLALAGPAVPLLFVLPAVLVIAIVGTSFWSVVIDRTGFSARAVFGWPHLRIPLEQIAEARVVTTDGLSDFGGWGLRWRPKAVGIILRGGSAIAVHRITGSRLVVTIDDAETAVALINGLKAQEGAASRAR